ncbi:hypothetical protein AWJ20_272 [Sugiyamaella lignohabitans]|uniref:Fmp52p n=1 Tax=Sugiyamaella lignohabitans TaxID=796027 RepID=A0A167CRY6_9ASCO|nr:uncharacterized protein AWJ20_272 [Sugiyamaella lignohabitans]ANB12039.1 hypothetical protein AWJ20_272 [Sugiyamaella lignohabitans]
MGIIFASPEYKKIINGKSAPSLCNVVNVGLSALRGANPLENGRPASNAFDRINRESAVTLAKAFASQQQTETTNPAPFVYISAHDWNPLAPRGYIQSKRAAETEISVIPHLRSVFLQPGFMYDSSSSSTVRDSLSKLLRTGEFISNATGLSSLNLLPNNPSISVQVVARATIEALDDQSVSGVVSLEALQKFAHFQSDPKPV